ncbi:hypothetical protein CaCOL14_003773 [Colletotrichum acutatum]
MRVAQTLSMFDLFCNSRLRASVKVRGDRLSRLAVQACSRVTSLPAARGQQAFKLRQTPLCANSELE